MADLNGFDANLVEPKSAPDPVPAGEYLAVITASEVKPTKSGNGQYLEFTFEIIEGEYSRRRLWARLNVDNPSAAAVKIARAELSAICRAVGVLVPGDSADLHNLPLRIDVRSKKRKDTDEIANEIKAFAPKDPPVVAVPAAKPAGVTTATKSTPPWQRK